MEELLPTLLKSTSAYTLAPSHWPRSPPSSNARHGRPQRVASTVAKTRPEYGLKPQAGAAAGATVGAATGATADADVDGTVGAAAAGGAAGVEAGLTVDAAAVDAAGVAAVMPSSMLPDRHASMLK